MPGTVGGGTRLHACRRCSLHPWLRLERWLGCRARTRVGAHVASREPDAVAPAPRPLPSLDDGHCGQVVEERLCDPSSLVLGQAVGDRRHLARASHRRRREHELDEVRLGVRPCEQGEVPRVDLLRSGGRVRAFATSAEVGDSRWKEFLIGDRC